jgi:ketosteroid isomerase-like protein
MASPNEAIEVVREVYGAFGRGDLPGILARLADDAEWKFVGSSGLPYTTTARGKEAIARWFGTIPTVDDIQAFEPRELISAGEHVTVLGWERTRARPSGKVFETDWVHVFTVRDGRVVRFFGMYDTEASARARG